MANEELAIIEHSTLSDKAAARVTERLSSRIVGYDVARAAAIFGMMIINFWVTLARDSVGDGFTASLLAPLWGRAAATFVMLAGIGVSLLTREARQSPEKIREKQRLLLKRALFLFIIGLMFHSVWRFDILHFYGAYLAIAALLVAAPDRWLLGAAAGATVGFVLMLFLVDYKTGWDEYASHYLDFWTVKGFLLNLFYNGDHPVMPWFTFLGIGMWIGRQDTSAAAFRRRLFLIGMALWVTAETASRGLASVFNIDPYNMENLEVQTALLSRQPIPPAPFFILAGIGAALMVISLCLTLGQHFEQARWLKPLVYTGQLALTIYIGHVIVGMGLLLALGNLHNHSQGFTFAYTGLVFVVSVIFSSLWKRRYAQGPLEWAMRQVSQPASVTPQKKRLKAARQRKVTANRWSWIAGAILVMVLIFALLMVILHNEPGESFPEEGNNHIAEPPRYIWNTRPATSGAHAPGLASWGESSSPISPWLYLHNMEDGGVVMHYNCPEACPEVVSELRSILQEVGRDKLILHPNPDMSARIAITAWARMITMETVNREQVIEFIDHYRGIDHHKS